MCKFTKRQNDIIQVSIELLNEGGSANLTIRKIAGKLSLTEGAIYRHFKSKDSIIEAIIFQVKSYYDKAIEIMKSDNNSYERLKGNYLYWGDVLSENPMFADFFLSDTVFKINEAHVNSLWEKRNAYRMEFIKVIKLALTEGYIGRDKNIEHISFIMIGTLRIQIQRWAKADEKINIQHQAKEVWDTLSNLIFDEVS